MAAVWMRLRAELRVRWRAVLGLTLLAGVPGGMIIATAVGADRTETVVARLVSATRFPDVFMVPEFQETQLAFEDVARLPAVAESLVLEGYGALPPAPEELEVSAPRGRGLTSDRVNIISGTWPRQDRVDEASITYRAADRFGWKVGTVVPLTLAGPDLDFEDDVEAPPGPSVSVRITAVTSSPGDFVGVAGPGLQLTPAFQQRYGSEVASYEIFIFRLHNGRADLPAFANQMSELSGRKGILYVESVSGVDQVKRGFHLHAVALRTLAIALTVVVTLIFAQAIARQTALESAEHGTMAALGMTPRDLTLLGLARSAIVALSSAAIAAPVAAALTWFTPLGTARLAEPNAGVSLPLVWYWGGLAALIVIVIGVAAIPALRAPTAHLRAGRERLSLIARMMNAITRRPAPAIGARLALEPGRGLTSVPIRSSLAAAITGIVALLATLSVGASVDKLLASPELFGWTWDVGVTGEFGSGSKDLEDLLADPSNVAVAVGYGVEGAVFRLRRAGTEAAEITTQGLTSDSVKGEFGPPIIEGRAPRGADEIALGRRTMNAVDVSLGGSIEVSLQGEEIRKRMRVVGVVVLPLEGDIASIGEGAWMTLAGVAPLAPELPPSPQEALIRFAPGADRDAGIARLRTRYGELFEPFTPGLVRDFRRISDLMAVMAGMLAALAAGTLVHLLTTSIRRRRRDLSILKTLGFSRRQLRSTVAWQAVVFAAVALLVALPIGIVVGRGTWDLIAGYTGIRAVPVVPPVAFLVVTVATIAAACAISVLPGRAAARSQPALVLRAE